MKKIQNKILILLVLLVSTSTVFAQKDNDVEIKLQAEIIKAGYVGETLVYELTLLSTTPNIADIKEIKAPLFPEDVKVINGIVGNYKFRRIDNKGKFKYSKLIQRIYIIPQSTGKLNIKGGEYVAFIPYERIINRGFWNSRVVEYDELRTESNSVSCKVNSLPKPSTGYEACVGDFRIQSWFPPGHINRGIEAFVIFKISGYGSLQTLKVPPLNKLFLTGCHLKEVEQTEELMQREGRLFSEVTLVCKFIPEEDNFEISSLCMEFFNPETKKYYNVCSEELSWTGEPVQKKRVESNNDAIFI